MTNIGTFILTNTDFQKVATLADITFDDDKIYTIQNEGDPVYIRAGVNNGKGNILNYGDICYYDTVGNDDLYVAPLYPNSSKEKVINISARGKKENE